jgi:DNA-binding MarR family transcriptional regulator
MERLENKEVRLWELLSQVFRNGRKRLEKELQRISMKPTEIKVLYSISTQDTTQMNNLADAIGITGPWITGVVDDLVSRGYVKKFRSKSDRRMISLSITPSGSQILSEGMLIYNRLLEELLSVLPDERVEELKEILEVLNSSLQ